MGKFLDCILAKNSLGATVKLETPSSPPLSSTKPPIFSVLFQRPCEWLSNFCEQLHISTSPRILFGIAFLHFCSNPTNSLRATIEVPPCWSILAYNPAWNPLVHLLTLHILPRPLLGGFIATVAFYLWCRIIWVLSVNVFYPFSCFVDSLQPGTSSCFLVPSILHVYCGHWVSYCPGCDAAHRGWEFIVLSVSEWSGLIFVKSMAKGFLQY